MGPGSGIQLKVQILESEFEMEIHPDIFLRSEMDESISLIIETVRRS